MTNERTITMSRGQRLLRQVANLVWGLTLLALLLVALYVGLGRQMMANLHHYTEQLEYTIASQIGRPVSIDQLSGSWRGLDPVVSVSGLQILSRDGTDVAATLGDISLRLDSRVSLQRLRLVFSQFSVTDADLKVIQQEEGLIGVSGLWMPERELAPLLEGLPEVPTATLEARVQGWLNDLGRILHEPSVQVNNLTLTLAVAGEPEEHFVLPQADLTFRRGLFRASGHLQRSDGNQRLALFALEGRHFFAGEFDGQAYVQLSSERLFDALLRRYQWQRLGIEGLEVDAQAWLQFQGGRPVEAVATLDLPYLAVSAPGGALSPLEDLGMTLGWRRQGHGWQASINELHYRWQDQTMLPASGLVTRDGEGLEIAVDQLDAGPLSRLLAATGLLPVRADEEMVERDPRGRVRNLALTLPDEKPWSFAAELDQVNVLPYGGTPGAEELSGLLRLGASGGEVRLRPGPVKVDYPQLFAGPWQFDHVSGRVSWQRRGDQFLVGSHDLYGRHPTGARFSVGFLLRLDPHDENTVSLQVGVADGHSDLLADFVPAGVIPGELYDFLSQQIVDTPIPWGWYFGHGTLEPDLEHPAFTSSMIYQFEQGQLDYLDLMPPLEEAWGEVQVHNAHARIELARGKVGATPLEPSRVEVIPTEAGPKVTIDTGTRVQGELLTEIWLRQSPLMTYTGEWLQDMTLTGGLDLGLQLDIYLGQERPPGIRFQAELDQAELSHKPSGLVWQQLTGALDYDVERGFKESRLEGSFKDSPVTLELTPSEEGLAEIHQRGGMPLASLSRWLEWPFPGIAGSLDYHLALMLSQTPGFRFEADLQSLGSRWPAPLDKRIGERETLQVSGSSPAPGQWEIQGNWQQRLAARLRWQDGAMERASLALGTGATALPETPGLHVLGAVPSIHIDQWREALTWLVAAADEEQGQNATAPGDEAAADTGSWQPDTLPPWFRSLNLSTQRLSFLNRELGPMALVAEPDDNELWRLSLQGDSAEGELVLHPDGPFRLDLSHLRLPDALDPTLNPEEDRLALVTDPEEESPLEAPGLGQLNARQRSYIPAIDVRIGQLTLGGTQQGQWAFDLRSQPQRVVMEALNVSFDDLAFNGELIWSHQGTVPRSLLKGQLLGGNIAALERFFPQGVPLRSNAMGVGIDLSWLGAPDAISLENLQGTLGFWLEDGRILEDSDTARIFGIFGLLNTDTLWRRLRLDFSDVSEGGIAFDSLEGKALITEGRLILDPDLTIRAPSGGFRMSGETNLLEETLDMRLVVVLPVTQNLPLAAVLVGAAPVAAALYLVDQLFGGRLSRITSATYSLQGTWQRPDAQLRNLFDTESDLRRYERPELNQSLVE
ncbi:MAG: hypothetical protein EA349_06575 [Halomonadaceae bacterium]|nr:MAG: hypothetical protein EA349_06575 [Halomonadaceae bacterium]